jgi:hypothetical protein
VQLTAGLRLAMITSSLGRRHCASRLQLSAPDGIPGQPFLTARQRITTLNISSWWRLRSPPVTSAQCAACVTLPVAHRILAPITRTPAVVAVVPAIRAYGVVAVRALPRRFVALVFRRSWPWEAGQDPAQEHREAAVLLHA